MLLNYFVVWIMMPVIDISLTLPVYANQQE